jgi:hypothetical protein
MKPNETKPRNRVAVSTPCHRCDKPFTTKDTRVDICPRCQASLTVAIHLLLEGRKEESLKRLRLFQLQLAVLRASRWLEGVDTSAIIHAVAATKKVKNG